MSVLATHKRKIIGLGVFGCVNNIEKRFSSGGGNPDHTPGVASPRGQPNQVMGKHEGHHGINTPHYQEKISEQTPQGTAMQKAFENQRYPNKGNGDEKGLK